MWQYDNEEGTNDMIIDIGQDIRFKVIEEKFIDISPKGKLKCVTGYKCNP